VSSSYDLVLRSNAPVEHLLRHCLSLGRPAQPRVPAKVRLEAALGPDLAGRLLATLTAGSRSRSSGL